MAVNCNPFIASEFMKQVKGLIRPEVNAGQFVQSCEYDPIFYERNFSVSSINNYAGFSQYISYLKRDHPVRLLSHLPKIGSNVGTKLVALAFDNSVESSNSVSGSLASVQAAIVESATTVYAMAGAASTTCTMRPQIQTVHIEKCAFERGKKICSFNPVQSSRAFEEEELSTVLEYLKSQAALSLYQIGQRFTGLNGGLFLPQNGLDDDLILKKFFRESKFEYIQMEGPIAQLEKALMSILAGQAISDYTVQPRIKLLAIEKECSSFFHVPNSTSLFVISVSKINNQYLIKKSSFTVVLDTFTLPIGAFGTSVKDEASWKLEKYGSISKPSAQVLMETFPYAK